MIEIKEIKITEINKSLENGCYLVALMSALAFHMKDW